LGNVVGFFDYTKIYERFTPILGIELDEFDVTSPGRRVPRADEAIRVWANCPDRIRRQTDGPTGLKLPYDEFVRAWEDIFWLNEPVARLIRFLKSSGYTLILGFEHECSAFCSFRRHSRRRSAILTG